MSAKITQKQVAGAKVAKLRGKELAKSHPEIAQKWRDGTSQSKLASLFLPGVPSEMAAGIIQRAIESLISSKKERSRIVKSHRKECGARIGAEAKRRRMGIFALSREQLRKNGKKAAQNLLRKLGLTPFDGEAKETEYGKVTEIEYVKELVKLKQKGMAFSWKLIRRHTNAIFGNNRSLKSVMDAYYYRENGDRH